MRFAALAILACLLGIPGSVSPLERGAAWQARYQAAWASWVIEHGSTPETWNRLCDPWPPFEELVRRADGR